MASWIGGIALETNLGPIGPTVVGTLIAALTLIPASAIAIVERRRVSQNACVASDMAC